VSLSDKIKSRMDAILKELDSSAFKKEVGEKITGNIKKRTRVGRATDKHGGTATAITKLSANYKKQRKSLRKSGVLSNQTTPAKSNLTKTGKMLDSLHHTTSTGRVSIEVGRDERRKATEVQEAGRPFLNLTNLDLKEITDLIKARVLKYLK
jgi:hypothetical protein